MVIMFKHNGIPHWGKINTILDDNLQAIKKYYPKLAQWQEVFKSLNANKTFSNQFSDRLKLGEL